MNLLVFSLEAEVHYHPETALHILHIGRQMQEFLDHPTTPTDISTYEILSNMTSVYQHSKNHEYLQYLMIFIKINSTTNIAKQSPYPPSTTG